jgi:NDP-sugar pyrophosphorylase family protein
MSLTIVVMAAGVGSRFGGPKQLEPVGPAGETLIDYLLVDARRAGFDRAVLVIRDELTGRIETVAARHRDGLEVALAYQTLGPDIPRGTVPAVLAAADRIDGPFVALNADDFYGTVAYQRAADFLRSDGVPATTHAFVSFPLRATLSPHGAVVRGVCQTSGDLLVRVDEIRGIEPHGTGAKCGDRQFTGDERVSMNFWAFQKSMLDELQREFAAFRQGHDSSHELLLPVTVDRLVTQGRVQVRVLSAPGPWLGLTHASDLPGARQALAGMAAAGDYPTPAWSEIANR